MKEVSLNRKKAKGTNRQTRTKSIPVLEIISDLTPPTELNEDARAVWSDIAPLLTEKAMLTHADRKMLTAYCIELANYFQYTKDISTEGPMLPLKNGKGLVINYMKNPLCDLASKSLKAAMDIGLHFGLTPASRGKLNIPAAKVDSPEERAKNHLESLKSKAGKVVKMAS